MTTSPIRSEVEYRTALRQIERLMAAEFGTPNGDRLDALTRLVEMYEAKHMPIEGPVSLHPQRPRG